MSDLKTKPDDASVQGFLDSAAEGERRQDCQRLIESMRAATGAEPKLWGGSMVGFGSYHYRYESGREGDFFVTGFAPRKRSLTLYIMSGFDRYDLLMSKLGKYSTGKSCLYVKRLADIDFGVLEALIAASVEHMRQNYEVS
ncbi:MAG: DUF1801 domain-containing protein [Gemmatimonadota bacterium]